MREDPVMGSPTRSIASGALGVLVLLGATGAGQAALPAQDTTTARVIEVLRSEAIAMQRETPAAWAAHEEAIRRILDEHAARTRGWRYQRPPPPPDLRAAALPAALLMAKVRGVESDREQRTLELAYLTALVASEDPRGLAAALELHDLREGVRRSHAAGTIAAAVPEERIGGALAHALRSGAPVRDGTLALRLLERARNAAGLREIALGDEVRAAAHAWLTTYDGGPENGLGDTIWRLRVRLGGAEDRDALVPFVLDAEDLLYDLRAVLEAPLAHEGLAAALRTRQARMTEHERSYLAPMMRRAIVVTGPDEEIDAWVEHLDALLGRADTSDVMDEPYGEFQVDVQVLADIEHPVAAAARRRYLADSRLGWSTRMHWLTRIVERGRSDAEQLRAWWREHAPPEEVERLREWLTPR